MIYTYIILVIISFLIMLPTLRYLAGRRLKGDEFMAVFFISLWLIPLLLCPIGWVLILVSIIFEKNEK